MIMSSSWSATVLTLFSRKCSPGCWGCRFPGKALAKSLWQLEGARYPCARVARQGHRTVDDTPAGGGPGMVMRANVAAGSVIDAARQADDERPLIYLSPSGQPSNQDRIRALAEGPGVLLFCARFEGLDQRAIEARHMEEISLGDFVLAGGEIAAMALIEAAVRLLPGVLGDAASPEEESFAKGLLEYPHFTRPQNFEDMPIPDVLTSGKSFRNF